MEHKEILSDDRAEFAAARRAEFPLFRAADSTLVYLDSGASQQKPAAVLDAMRQLDETSYANVHRGVYSLSQRATEAYESARNTVQKFINARSTSEVIFTHGTTEGLNLVANSYGRAFLKEGDEIVLTIFEHHSNIVPWQLIAEEKGCRIRWVYPNANGMIGEQEFRAVLSSRTKIVAFTALSNVMGASLPVRSIVDAAHQVGAVAVVDAAQAAPHLPIDVQRWNVDFLAFSGHKVYGPTGIGVLYGRESLLEVMPPFFGGGDMIRSVTVDGSTFNDLPYKFEAGTPAITQAVGLGAAIDYISGIGLEVISAHEQSLLSKLINTMHHTRGVTILGNLTDREALVSFVVDNVHPHDLAQYLDSKNIAIRAGHHCAQPLMKFLGHPATSRVSLSCYTSPDDIRKFSEALHGAIKFFQ